MQTQTLVFQKTRGGQFRWLTVSTLLLSIGTILHIASPSIAGFTPNWMIATYCVAILLTKPTYRQCFGIGMVAACIEILTSKSGFPYGNLISEPLGAMTAACFAPERGLRRRRHIDQRVRFCIADDIHARDCDQCIFVCDAPGGWFGRGH